MSIQIAVRLPEKIVEFLDRTVAEGRALSRAAVVSSALEREMRLRAGQRDVEILGDVTAPDDLDALVSWSAGNVSLED